MSCIASLHEIETSELRLQSCKSQDFKEMVYCYQNCSSVQEKLMKFEAEGREFPKFLRPIEQFIQTVKG